VQTSLSARYTSLHFVPDLTGDLLYNGIAQDAFKDDTAIGWQTDAAYKINDTHTVRAGLYFQHDRINGAIPPRKRFPSIRPARRQARRAADDH
jgi:outer membrane receptor for ferrienterochelin and colicins